MLSIQLLVAASALVSAILGLATAYLNFRAAQKLVKSREQVKRRWW